VVKEADVDQPLSPPKTLGITGQKSLRNQNRRKKRMLTAEVPRTKMSDPVVNKQTALQTQTGGTHYKNMAIQPAEYAEKNGLSLLEGNVVKYITRWKLKGQPLSDLEKAKHCIDLLIEIHNVK
jgi:hypothetical protein